VRFQAALRGTLQLARTNAFFLGGGTALMNSLYAAAARHGIDVRYDAEVVGLDLRDGAFAAVWRRARSIS
jgi:tricarballylate dehydrogenase